MGRLSSKQEAFITLMKTSDEHARRGFELLLKQPGFEEFFDDLAAIGLFDPACNPAPVPAEQPGSFRIPYWDALNYLEAVARISGEKDDLELAEKVMNVVRAVSRAREPDGTIRDNYYTYHKFAEILGLVPTVAVIRDDLDLIPGWLAGEDVGHAREKGAMHRFLASELPDDWNKACLILRHCTAILWIDQQELGTDCKRPMTVVGDHWLKKLINNHTKTLGERVGKKAAEILVERVRETFDSEHRNLPSWRRRPAVEDHTQNHEWLGPENRFVEGLRDVLLSWIAHEPSTAQPYVEAMLRDEMEIIRRIGIYILNHRWEVLRRVYLPLISPDLFDHDHLHELYALLHDRFATFSLEEKAATIEAIQLLPPPSVEEDQDRRLRIIQRNWLSAIAGKEYEPAETWFRSLIADETIGRLSDHPDFHTYTECISGPGPSAYQSQELVAFAENGSLIERLNAFRQSDSWRGPTTQALVDSLEEAVGLAPQIFLRHLPDFLNAKRPFQYGVIAGFKSLWVNACEVKPSLDWDKAWVDLIQFFEQVIGSSKFWTEQVAHDDRILTPNRDWIPPIIAEFLRAETQDDKKAYPTDLLPKTWEILKVLLEKSTAVEEAHETDAMHQAINSAKGKAIEAALSHVLQACRLSDREKGEHARIWAEMKPVFEAELAKCQNANYEFSTLAGAYLPNLDYIDRDWLQSSIGKIFPCQFTNNFRCALGGLAYASMTPQIYALLVESDVLDQALRDEIKDRSVREKLIECMALEYLLGREELDSPRFAYLFDSTRVEDLEEAGGWFWSIRKEQLSPEQVERILHFWNRCVSWSLTATEPPAKLLSNLSRLSCYLQAITEKERLWLLAVAPYVNVDYNDDFFFEELGRLADINPGEVSKILKAVFDTYIPHVDYEDRLKSLIQKLADCGMREEAISFTERLRNIPGMIQLYKNLVSG